MRIVFAGTPEVALPTLRALLAEHEAGRHELVAVLTRPEARVGRGRTTRQSPVAILAEEAGIPVLTAARASELPVTELRALAPELGVVVAYGVIIPPAVLELPRRGWINVHFSVLPRWRGAAPVAAAIRAGDNETGATVFQLDQGVDTGPVFGSSREPIAATDTAGDLLSRLADRGAELLIDLLPDIAADQQASAQPTEGASHVGKITAADARVDFADDAVTIDRQIRALTPDPGATVESRWGTMTLGPVEPVDAPAQPLAPGELLVTKRAVFVGTGTVPVRLSTVTAPGRKAMPAADWARGARPEPGERFGDEPAAPSEAEK